MDDQTCRTCENCRHREKRDEELPCFRCGPGLNYWQPNKADLARAEAPPAAEPPAPEPPAPEGECARGGKMMSKHAPLSRKTVETLRDFAFAYYCEHEGPSESEHKARDLAQALDGDLARAAQAMPEPICLCMCGHCESWSDDGDGMGWCCEHNIPTVSGHTCKRARPKAEYAEPAGEAEAPISEPPAPEGECAEIRWPYEMPEGAAPSSIDEVLRACNERWLSQGDYGRDEEGDWGRHAACLVALAAERDRLREELAAVQARWANADAMLDLYAKLDATLNQWQEFAERLRQDELAGTNERAEQAEARAQEAEDSLAEAESKINDLENLLANAEASAQEAESQLNGARRTLQIPAWMPISERVIEVMMAHRNAEARALAAEKRAEGCYPLPSGMTRNEWRDQLALWGRVCRLEPLDKSIELIKGLLAGLTIERGTEIAEAIADEVERLTEQRPEVVHL